MAVKPSGQKKYKSAQLTGQQFVRSFCQHILPNGFQKVRFYGFMSPNSNSQPGFLNENLNIGYVPTSLRDVKFLFVYPPSWARTRSNAEATQLSTHFEKLVASGLQRSSPSYQIWEAETPRTTSSANIEQP